MNWKELVANSHYQTAVRVQQELTQGHIQESQAGLEELIAALGRAEKRALTSQLTRLMMHIIKWKIQPQRRSRSWIFTISSARVEITEILEYEPHLKSQVSVLWDKCFKTACRFAQDETGLKPTLQKLSWQEVFEDEYNLEE